MIAPILHPPTRTFVLIEVSSLALLPAHKVSKWMAFAERCDRNLHYMIDPWDTFIIPEVFYPDGTSKEVDGWPK